MRTEKEMLQLILTFATQNDSVRAVVMNGSRVNPNAPRDPFQDYDIAYLVRDVAQFRRRAEIPTYFGDPMIVQLPEDMQDPPPQGGDRYVYLMQFKDGARIDLGINRLAYAKEIVTDSLSLVLMDKDGFLGQLPPPSDADYLTRSPTEQAFNDCCNEFWWLNIYAAKAIWRDQLPFVVHIMEGLLRPQLVKMLCWAIVVSRGMPTAFGKHGAHLGQYMEPHDWALFRSTYVGAEYASTWASLRTFGELFRAAGARLALELGYTYLEKEDLLVSDFLRKIQQLPAGSPEI